MLPLAFFALLFATAVGNAADITSLRRGAYVNNRVTCSEAANSTLMWFNGSQFNAGRFCPASIAPGQTGSKISITRDCPAENPAARPNVESVESIFEIISPTAFQVEGRGTYLYCAKASLPAIWRTNYESSAGLPIPNPHEGIWESDVVKIRITKQEDFYLVDINCNGCMSSIVGTFIGQLRGNIMIINSPFGVVVFNPDDTVSFSGARWRRIM